MTTNNSSSASVSTGGVGTLAMVILTIALGYCKVQGILDISWWIVFLPMYFGILIFVVLAILFFAGWGVAKLIDKRKEKKRLALAIERRAKQDAARRGAPYSSLR